MTSRATARVAMPLPAACTATGDAPADEHDVCRQCLFALLNRGHVPGRKIDHFAYRLLLFLLAQGPGYVARRHTLAKKLDTNDTTVKVGLARLRAVMLGPDAPLLRTALAVPLNGTLPWRAGAKATANLNGYEVR